MKILQTPTFNRTLFFFLILALSSCLDEALDKDDTDDNRVDLTIDIDGKKTEFISPGFTISNTATNKQELWLPFAKEASTLTIDELVVTVPNFKDTKTNYDAKKGEVAISYKENSGVYAAKSTEWLSTEGILEITSLSQETIKGKLNVTVKMTGSTKTILLKNGEFTAQNITFK